MLTKACLPLALAVLSSAAIAADAATPSKPQTGAQPAATTTAPQGRDWTRIDTNKDGHISPEEMEKYLAENPGPQRS